MISLFTSAQNPIAEKNISENDYFESIRMGTWQDEVLKYRSTGQDKIKIKAVTASGVFKERKSDKLIEHSGFICIDIDAKDQICEIDIEQLKRDHYTYCVHKSVGGFGYALFVKIDAQRHLDAFLGLQKYFFTNYSIVIDKSCKDTSRLRFVSYDPDIFINEKAIKFKEYLKKKEIKQAELRTIVVKSDFDAMVNQASSMNLFDEYSDYLLCAFALSTEFGEAGRSYFHSLCGASAKYDQKKCDKDFTTCLKRNGTGITIASIYKKFKEAGISLTSEKTERIKSIAKISIHPATSLKELGIDDTENLLQKFTVENKDKTNIDLVIDLISLSKIRFNEITRNFEMKGEIINDRILAQFYTQVWQKIDEEFPAQKIWTLIQNRNHSLPYNPIRDWFAKNVNETYSNEFDKVKECFEIKHTIFENGVECRLTDYLDVYLKKWMLSIVASAHGTYSLMILVLIGEQGTNKTEFFRNLLPVELRKYYAESNLDEGKDSEILLTKKLLVIDDEFGGKSKKDATKLKRLSSQQTFSIRMPYGRISEDLERLAVLGGTGNDEEVINDPTGNRRIIPINVISLDIEKFRSIDKNKLFIELYHEWKANPTGWFLDKNEIDYLNQATITNVEVMAEIELINEFCFFYEHGELTNTQIRNELEKKFIGLKTTSKRIGQALKKCGFKQFRSQKDGVQKRIYKIQINSTVLTENVFN